MHIKVQLIPVTTERCVHAVSDQIYRYHIRKEIENPSRCNTAARCLVGGQKMCRRHAQQHIFSLLLTEELSLVSRKQAEFALSFYKWVDDRASGRAQEALPPWQLAEYTAMLLCASPSGVRCREELEKDRKLREKGS